MASPVQAARTCACGRTFRPTSGLQVRCGECIRAFASGEYDAEQERRATREIIRWPTPPGICAHLGCRKPFEGYTNQRYCSWGCHDAAITQRAAARKKAAEQQRQKRRGVR